MGLLLTLAAAPATLAAWLHTIDPYAVRLWEGGPIRWYGVSYLIGFALGFLLVRRVCRVGRSPLPASRAADFVVATALGALVGGRVGYAVFYRPELLGFSGAFPFWGVFDMLRGGMSSHGGMVGALVGAAWFCGRRKVPVLFGFDLLAFGAPLGLACGRIANFVNGELPGKVAEPGFPLAVQFPQELAEDPGLFDRFAAAFGGEVPADWLSRIQAGSESLSAAAAAVLPARHPSPLYAASLEGVLVFAVLAVVWMRPRRAGTVAGAFGLAYAVARILGEFWRMPDAHLPEHWLGLSRGQWLSVPLALAGLGLTAFAAWRRGPRMGGWRAGAAGEEAVGAVLAPASDTDAGER